MRIDMAMRTTLKTHARPNGFTIVELVVIVVVIAILATIATVGFNAIVTDSRDSDRKAKVTLISEALERYYQRGGAYPTCAQMTGTADSVVALLPGIDKATLVAPEAPASTTNSIVCTDLTSTNGADVFSYTTTSTGYTLKYKAVASNQVVSVASRTQPIAIPGETGICPAAFITVPGNSSFGTTDFCVMKYEAKNVGSVATSQPSGTLWVSMSQNSAITRAQTACTGCHLMSEAEWMTIAANVISVPSNWVSGTVGTGSMYTGHSDNSPANSLAASTDDSDGYYLTGNTSGTQRRTLTLTNGQVIWDFSGNIGEYTTGTISSGNHAGLTSQSSGGWLEWTNSSLMFRGIPASSRPSAISSTVGTWSDAQGVGRLYTYYSNTITAGFMRGGSYNQTNNVGVLTLQLNTGTNTAADARFGFRSALTL
jgi:Tfp pilus assembly protein PilE